MNDTMLYVRPDRIELNEVGEPAFGVSPDIRVAVSGHIGAERKQVARGGYRVLALDGDKWKVRPGGNYAHAGGNGFGINENGAMYTLNTVDRHIVAVIAR